MPRYRKSADIHAVWNNIPVNLGLNAMAADSVVTLRVFPGDANRSLRIERLRVRLTCNCTATVLTPPTLTFYVAPVSVDASLIYKSQSDYFNQADFVWFVEDGLLRPSGSTTSVYDYDITVGTRRVMRPNEGFNLQIHNLDTVPFGANAWLRGHVEFYIVVRG